MTSILINDAAIPFDNEPGTADPSELTCEVCGTELAYSGRGRKPKRCEEHKPTSSRAKAIPGSTADVKAALAVLDTMYSTVTVGLFMFAPNTASVWAEQAQKLSSTNAAILAGDKELTKQICRMGQTSSKAIFYGSHAMALVPVALALREEIAERRKTRDDVTEAPADHAAPLAPPVNSFFA